MKEQIFTWCYRIFTFFVPGGVVLWSFLIEKLIDQEVSYFTKIGVGGITILAIIIITAVFFLGKHFRKKIIKINEDINTNMKDIMLCTNEEQKALLTAELQSNSDKLKRVQARQEIFHNICFITPFLLAWLIVSLIETQAIELRGTLAFVTMSMAVGFGFNGLAQYVRSR